MGLDSEGEEGDDDLAPHSDGEKSCVNSGEESEDASIPTAAILQEEVSNLPPQIPPCSWQLMRNQCPVSLNTPGNDNGPGAGATGKVRGQRKKDVTKVLSEVRIPVLQLGRLTDTLHSIRSRSSTSPPIVRATAR